MITYDRSAVVVEVLAVDVGMLSALNGIDM